MNIKYISKNIWQYLFFITTFPPYEVKLSIIEFFSQIVKFLVLEHKCYSLFLHNFLFLNTNIFLGITNPHDGTHRYTRLYTIYVHSELLWTTFIQNFRLLCVVNFSRHVGNAKTQRETDQHLSFIHIYKKRLNVGFQLFIIYNAFLQT